MGRVQGSPRCGQGSGVAQTRAGFRGCLGLCGVQGQRPVGVWGLGHSTSRENFHSQVENKFGKHRRLFTKIWNVSRSQHVEQFIAGPAG